MGNGFRCAGMVVGNRAMIAKSFENAQICIPKLFRKLYSNIYITRASINVKARICHYLLTLRTLAFRSAQLFCGRDNFNG